MWETFVRGFKGEEEGVARPLSMLTLRIFIFFKKI